MEGIETIDDLILVILILKQAVYDSPMAVQLSTNLFFKTESTANLGLNVTDVMLS